MNKNSIPAEMGLSVPRKLEECRSVWAIQKRVMDIFYQHPPEAITKVFMRPVEIEKLLHRPALKPYFKTGQFGANYQLSKILMAVFSGCEKGEGGDLSIFLPMLKTKVYRKFKRQFAAQKKYKLDKTKLPYAKRLVRNGFTVDLIVQCIEAKYAPVDPDYQRKMARTNIRAKFIHRHKGRKLS